MFENENSIKTNVNQRHKGEGQPKDALAQTLYPANAGDQELNPEKVNALNKDPGLDTLSYTHIPAEEVRHASTKQSRKSSP